MKKIILTIPALLVMAGLFFAGCTTPAEKAETAEVKVEDAKKDLTEAQMEAAVASKKATDAAAWKEFKAETELKISKNELRIAEIKAQIKKSGKNVSLSASQKIDTLELHNKNFKARLENYDNGQTNWDFFKNEFSRDMEGLAEALKNFIVSEKSK